MKPYEYWEFCKSINCEVLQKEKKQRYVRCSKCPAYQMHQYLCENGQILEAGSELEKLVAEAEKLRSLQDKVNAEYIKHCSKCEYDHQSHFCTESCWPRFYLDNATGLEG